MKSDPTGVRVFEVTVPVTFRLPVLKAPEDDTDMYLEILVQGVLEDYQLTLKQGAEAEAHEYKLTLGRFVDVTWGDIHVREIP